MKALISLIIAFTLVAAFEASAETIADELADEKMTGRDWVATLMANRMTLEAQGISDEEIDCVASAAAKMLNATQKRTTVTLMIAATALKSASKNPAQSCVLAVSE